MVDPAETRVRADLCDSGFLAGIAAGRWRVTAFKFPRLDFAISATERDGNESEYCFLGELSGYPAINPMVRIWDMETDSPLGVERRPTGNQRVVIAFQLWGDDTVYRPWDRRTGPHNNNAITLPQLAWRSDRHLAFIFEDLHGILNLNARAHRIRAAA